MLPNYVRIYDNRFRKNNFKKWEHVWNEIQLKRNMSVSDGLLLMRDHENKVIGSLWIEVQGEPNNFGRLLMVRYRGQIYREIDEYIKIAMKNEFSLEVEIYKENRILMGTVRVNVDAMWAEDKQLGYSDSGKIWEHFLVNSITVYDTTREKLNRIKSLNLEY